MVKESLESVRFILRNILFDHLGHAGRRHKTQGAVLIHLTLINVGKHVLVLDLVHPYHSLAHNTRC